MRFPSMVAMPEREYFALPFASQSRLATLLEESPMRMKYGETPQSESQLIGKIVHLLLLEPHREQYIHVRPQDANKSSNLSKRRLLRFLESSTGRTSTAGASLAEGKMLSARITELEPFMEDITHCSEAEISLARHIRDRVMERSISKAIFMGGNGSAEICIFAEIDGVKCKARMDLVRHDRDIIVDLKTTSNIASFRSSAANYNYHLQAAFYKMIYREAAGRDSTFINVAVETDPPFDVGFFELDDEAINAGTDKIFQALSIWKQCEENNIWPGTGWDWIKKEYEIQLLSLPKWAL